MPQLEITDEDDRQLQAIAPSYCAGAKARTRWAIAEIVKLYALGGVTRVGGVLTTGDLPGTIDDASAAELESDA